MKKVYNKLNTTQNGNFASLSENLYKTVCDYHNVITFRSHHITQKNKIFMFENFVNIFIF